MTEPDTTAAATDSAPIPNAPAGGSGPPSWLIFAVGLAIGIALTALAVVAFGDDDEDPGADGPVDTVVDPTTPVPDPEQAALVDAFLDAWFRYRTGTFAIEWDYERRLDSGDVLPSTAMLVQRPPDRLYGLLGSVSGTYAGEQVNCDAQSEERRCFATATSDDYVERMRSEQGTRSLFFVGSPPLYEVASPSAGCFDVAAVGAAAFLPWGESAQFCFDDATGALTSSVIDHGDLTETFTATSITTDVTDTAFTALLDG